MIDTVKNFDIDALISEAEAELRPVFEDIDRISERRTRDIIDSFRKHNMSEACLYPTSGYGYGDRGRETLDLVYADVFGTEAACVRHSIANGTHALTIGLFGLLRTGDKMLSVTGAPYDTLEEVIGKRGEVGVGSLRDYGIEYDEIDLADGKIDYDSLEKALAESENIKVVYAQRSRGYSTRRALTVAQLDELADFVHARSNAYVVVDNCYGEFTEMTEPKADLFIGSLIKNPGGGLAMSGGYFAGTKRAVELASYRMTSPGIGGEVGATIGQNRHMIQGFFMAPHTVAASKKTAALAAYIFEKLGYEVSPRWNEKRSDIIETVKFGFAEGLCAFCRGIQYGSPIDSYVTPEPWDMPGYADPVIMAAGTFVSGASIELSADGPIREPYIAYLQGGLTYESGKYGIKCAAEEVLKLSR